MIFLDKDRLLEKMDELEKHLRELDEYLPEEKEDYLNSGLIKRACGRAFQLASENLLVHQYGHVDDSGAYSYLNIESKDFYEFIETIDKYIELEDGKPRE